MCVTRRLTIPHSLVSKITYCLLKACLANPYISEYLSNNFNSEQYTGELRTGKWSLVFWHSKLSFSLPHRHQTKHSSQGPDTASTGACREASEIFPRFWISATHEENLSSIWPVTK